MKTVKCNKCGWHHFEVDQDYVISWRNGWLEYNSRLQISSKGQGFFGFDPDITSFTKCFRCGNTYKDFSDVIKPLNGVTIQPILGKNYEVPKV